MFAGTKGFAYLTILGKWGYMRRVLRVRLYIKLYLSITNRVTDTVFAIKIDIRTFKCFYSNAIIY